MCILAFIENCCCMAEHREHAQVGLTKLSLTDHSGINATSYNKTFKGHTCKDVKSLLISLSLSEKDTDLTCTTDKKTIVNLTHHAFFSPSGIEKDTASVENNILTLNADHYCPVDENSIPYGRIDHVEGTPMDFREPHVVGDRIDADHEQTKYGVGYDHCWVLNKRETGELSFAAKCVEPNSGRVIECYTTEPGVQVYTSNWHSGFEGAHGATFPKRSAICFEAQHFPDSPNKAHFPSVVLNPGEVYTQTTVYKFGVEE